MTEAEWLNCTDPETMYRYLRSCSWASDRKLRLWACACCRMIWNEFDDERSKFAVETGEQHADGHCDDGALQVAHDLASAAHMESSKRRGKVGSFLSCAAVEVSGQWPLRAAKNVFWMVAIPREDSDSLKLHAAQTGLLRDLFGNPFRMTAFDHNWLTWNDATVPKFAQGIYDERAFDRLPILADALEDAGCDNPDILAHLRGPGPHVRGCWVVDLLLGKS